MKKKRKNKTKTKRSKNRQLLSQHTPVQGSLFPSPDEFILYTDGSGDNASKIGEGGYAYLITDINGNHIKEFSDGAYSVTSNQMELKAIIEGCKAIPMDNATVTVCSDSMYALNVLSGRYKAHVNLSLVTEHEQNKKRLRIKYSWIKGHDGNKFNEYVDKLAGEARRKAIADKSSMEGLASHQQIVPSELVHAANDTTIKRAKYYVYATSIRNYGYVGNAYMVLDEKKNLIEKNSSCVKGNQFACILRTITTACHAVPEIDADVIVSSDVSYGIYILSGRWTPKKNFRLIQEQWDYDKFCNVRYMLCEPDNMAMKEVRMLATQSIVSAMNTAPITCVDEDGETDVPDNIVEVPQSGFRQPDHYRIAFTAINTAPDKVKCCYAVSRDSDSVMRTDAFDEDFDADNPQQAIKTLALVILVEAFKGMPDDATATIYSKDCYQFLSDVFNDRGEFDIEDAYFISLLKYAQSGELRSVTVENSDRSRLKHALERKLRQEGIE